MKFSINDFILWEVIRGNSIAADAEKHLVAQRNQTEAIAERILQLSPEEISAADRIRAQVIVQQKQDRLEREDFWIKLGVAFVLFVGIALWSLLFPTTPSPVQPQVYQPPTAWDQLVAYITVGALITGLAVAIYRHRKRWNKELYGDHFK